jgi:curved DNA-binding protein CbpA
MSVGEAAKLLGVSTDADPAQIVEAHKRLIGKVHPDAGGSAILAAQVNQARDTLLRHISS